MLEGLEKELEEEGIVSQRLTDKRNCRYSSGWSNKTQGWCQHMTGPLTHWSLTLLEDSVTI